MTNDFTSNSSVSRKEKEDVVLAMTESKSFVAFDSWMDSQLAQLVAQWIHTAAPNANRLERVQNRFSH
jgi:hypothetical protein